MPAAHTQQRDGLKSLAQAHLVRQDSVDPVLVEGDHPVEAAHLVVPHLTTLHTHKLKIRIRTRIIQTYVRDKDSGSLNLHQLFTGIFLLWAADPIDF